MEEKKKRKEKSEKEEDDILIEALRNEPGLTELMIISQQLTELRKLTSWYLDMASPRPISASSNTSE